MEDNRSHSGHEPGSPADDLVRFFHALRDAAQRQHRALAEADRAFGEDVLAERRASRERA